MNGTLSISGDLAVLAQVAEDLAAKYPNGITTTVETPSFGGWTVETMVILYRKLAPKQALLLEQVSAAGGYQDAEQLRDNFANDRGQLSGLTGPISKHVLSMSNEGLIPAGATPPVVAERDAENRGNQRTSGIRMAAGLVPVVRAAIDSTRQGRSA